MLQRTTAHDAFPCTSAVTTVCTKVTASGALEGNLIADVSSGEEQTAQPSWVCQPEHLAPGMELVL